MGAVLYYCRCCGESFSAEPVLSYHDMPARAQDFPFARDLGQDKGIDLTVLQCPYCGLIQIQEGPVAYYRDVLRAVSVSEDMKQFRRRYFGDFLSRFGLENGRIIEIGAGCGEYMELFAELGANVFGLEHRKRSVTIGREKDLQIFQGFIDGPEENLPGGPYDAFYTLSFIEHLPDPNRFLRGVRNGLREDGVGIVEVPNGEFILKSRLFSEFMLDHLSYFTEDTLRLILEKNGFRVLSCNAIWNEYILSAIVQKRSIHAVWPLFQQNQGEIVYSIREYAGKICGAGGRLAVWGAGHQSLALLALARLQEFVSFVVDSASFKQGRYTPATHIPVVGPDCIEREKMDAVLIIAGSYTQEITDIVRMRWPWVDIAIVNECGVTELERKLT